MSTIAESAEKLSIQASGTKKPKCFYCSCETVSLLFVLFRCVEAEGIDYHPRCLTCTMCSASLTKGYIIRQGKRFCSACDDKLDSSEWQCNKCGFQNSDSSVACAVCRTEQTWTEDSPLVAVLSGNTPLKPDAPASGNYDEDALLEYHHDAVTTLLERNPLGNGLCIALSRSVG